ncbi:cytochrome c biogenesis protein CcdA [Natronobacterium gregoryi]|uniref:Cytochrome C biogenesis protein n=2 Tax=Natronobacterium gregoryi TaxID=44930 RepID=L0AN09_NATGS|nr:cytochrome c biogenesis protein CcdA [Natronobacterium gregoryi]AFZ74465.1 cytochrome c biogenesis protein [Natronobacterium gregoryi SP2]ELY72260.1 cytochrome C biogenesis protein transmembrane region [Natronobacterium gregoryi SP2]PLK21787.1 cytochrome C biogenesis protein [Natronobacterium gregoryi SP2]SFJ46017.1 cytochrome c-type biogenesis protein [Natronobacterium gregoryi]
MFDATIFSTLGFALIAGIGTFFSPCAYPLLPGYVGFYVSQTDQQEASIGGAVSRGLIAGAGVLVTLAVVLGVAYQVGHATLSNVVYFEPIVGVVLLVFGALILVDRAPSLSVALPQRRSSVLGFGVFGAGYALAAAGCALPLLLPVVTSAMQFPPTSAALVLGTYVGSIVVLMVALTVATGMGLVASAGRLAGYSERIRQFAGVVMIVAGVGQLYLAIFVLDVM